VNTAGHLSVHIPIMYRDNARSSDISFQPPVSVVSIQIYLGDWGGARGRRLRSIGGAPSPVRKFYVHFSAFHASLAKRFLGGLPSIFCFSYLTPLSAVIEADILDVHLSLFVRIPIGN